MTKTQLFTLLKALVTGSAAPLALILSHTGIADPTVKAIVEIAGVLVSVLGAAWLTTDKSDANNVIDAGAVPGVQVHVNTDPAATGAFPVAPKEVQEIALKPAAPGTPESDVVPMVGGPRNDGV